ncbi:MAG: hypothetical protein HYR96_00900 [Deltaproteobacteria bacterium]|nr:hypothetical protein [Deltaproteobacteria bacterium]
MVEGLARFYEKGESHPKKYTRLHKDAKRFEDAIGKAGEWRDRLTAAKAMKAQDDVINYFASESARVDRELIQFAREEKWLAGPRSGLAQDWMNDLSEEIDAEEWGSYRHDKKFLIGSLADYSHEIDKALHKDRYDFEDLEGGIHELRRNIRWLSILFQASNGLVLTRDSKCPLEKAKETALLNSSIAKGPFSKLDGDERNISPCFISHCVYLELSRLIEELGLIKDWGQVTRWMREGYEHQGLNPDSVLPLIADLPELQNLKNRYPRAQTTAQMAIAVAQEMKATQILSLLESELNACIRN